MTRYRNKLAALTDAQCDTLLEMASTFADDLHDAASTADPSDPIDAEMIVDDLSSQNFMKLLEELGIH